MDKYGVESWDPRRRSSFAVHLIEMFDYCALTGEAGLPTPITAAAYAAAGLPWFDVYDEHEADLKASEALARIKSVRELENRPPEAPVEVESDRIETLHRRSPKNK